jgi:hypothetical protein
MPIDESLLLFLWWFVLRPSSFSWSHDSSVLLFTGRDVIRWSLSIFMRPLSHLIERQRTRIVFVWTLCYSSVAALLPDACDWNNQLQKYTRVFVSTLILLHLLGATLHCITMLSSWMTSARRVLLEGVSLSWVMYHHISDYPFDKSEWLRTSEGFISFLFEIFRLSERNERYKDLESHFRKKKCLWSHAVLSN